MTRFLLVLAFLGAAATAHAQVSPPRAASWKTTAEDGVADALKRNVPLLVYVAYDGPAAEWVGPYDDEKLGFVKVAQNYYYPGWWEGCGQGHNLINLAKWNELPKVYQNMIQVAGGEAWAWVVGKYDYANPAALKKLISQGAVLRPFPQPVLEACYNAAQEVYAEHNKSNPMFKKLHDSLIPFRNDSFAWQQVAELGFDSFMMRMRTRT